MQALSLSELRGIVGVRELESRGGPAETGDKAEQKQGEQKTMDMEGRRLPPPKAYFSEGEKFAWMLNKNEESFLTKVLDHINTQERVTRRSMDRDASVMRVKSARFLERAEQSRKQQFEMREKLKRRPYTANASLDTIPEKTVSRTSFLLKSSSKTIVSPERKSVKKTSSYFGYHPVTRCETPNETGFTKLKLISNILHESDMLIRNKKMERAKLLSRSAPNFGNRTGPSYTSTLTIDACPSEVTSSAENTDKFITRLPSKYGSFSEASMVTASPYGSKLQDGCETRPVRVSRYNKGIAEREIKKELKRLDKLRNVEAKTGPSVDDLLKHEKDKKHKTGQKLTQFCEELKCVTAKRYSKWDMQELEKKLKL